MAKIKDFVAGLLIFLSVIILYFSTVKFAVDFSQMLVPTGDPFSYDVNFFRYLDFFHSHGFVKNILVVLLGNWYWLVNFMLAILSPVLIKEPYSIALVNFVMFGIASFSLFRLARYLKFSTSASLILSLIIWAYPCNYGFKSEFSLYVMQLDTLFLWAVTVAALNLMIYVLDPTRTKNAIIAGVLTGLAVWGRGNSFPYVFIVIAYPLLLIIYQLFRAKDIKSLLNLLFYCFIVLFMSGIFLGLNFSKLYSYYTPHIQISLNPHINFQIPIIILKRYPGALLWEHAHGINNVIQSILMHGIMFFSFYWSRNLNKNVDKFQQFAVKRLVDCGLVIFYGTFIFNIVILRSKALIYSCHVFETMLVGFTLSLAAVVLIFLTKIESRSRAFKWKVLMMAFFFALALGVLFSKVQTVSLASESGAATPGEVQEFASDLEVILNNGSLSVLWYELYNEPILEYYRIKKNLPEYNFYENSFKDTLWMQGWHATDAREKVRVALKKTFTEADFIVIPEYLDSYSQDATYGLYIYKDEIARYLNSPQSPKFVVRMVLHDVANIRLLLLQRKDESWGQGEDLKLPYGPRPINAGMNYLHVVSDQSMPVINEYMKELSYKFVAQHCQNDHNDKCGEIIHHILDPKRDSYVYLQLGFELNSLGADKMAITLLNRCITLYPRYKEAYLLMGVILGNEGHYEESIDIWKRGLAIDPADLRFVPDIEKAKDLINKGH